MPDKDEQEQPRRQFTDFDEQLGFVDEVCRYCGAFKHTDSTGKGLPPICLNGCELPHGLMVKMNAELSAIWNRIQAENREKGIH